MLFKGFSSVKLRHNVRKFFLERAPIYMPVSKVGQIGEQGENRHLAFLWFGIYKRHISFQKERVLFPKVS
jgi:hypothetical protein